MTKHQSTRIAQNDRHANRSDHHPVRSNSTGPSAGDRTLSIRGVSTGRIARNIVALITGNRSK